MTPALTHIWLLVEDIPRALNFYHEALGLEIGSNLGEYVELKANEQFTLALFTRSAMQDGEPQIALTPASGQRGVLSFEVASVDEIANSLRDKDVRLTSEPADHQEWGLRTLILQDPDGSLLCLYTDISAQPPA